MKIRNCAWLDLVSAEAGRAVWARGRVITYQCPKSIISPVSQSFLELHAVWKKSGGGSLLAMDAKSADAIMMLEEEWGLEEQDEIE